MASKIKNLGYRIVRYTDGQYEHLELDVLPMDRRCSNDPFVSFSWQCDRNSRSWYACHLAIKADDSTRLAESFAIVKTMRLEYEFFTSPQTIIDTIEAIGARQATYDGRVSTYVYLDECLPAHVDSYREDYRRLGRTCCMASALASSDEDARKQIRTELASQSGDSVIEFINAGEPVMVVDSGDKVDRRLTSELIISELAKKDEEVAA